MCLTQFGLKPIAGNFGASQIMVDPSTVEALGRVFEDIESGDVQQAVDRLENLLNLRIAEADSERLRRLRREAIQIKSILSRSRMERGNQSFDEEFAKISKSLLSLGEDSAAALGVPEPRLVFHPLQFVDEPSPAISIFISYRRADSADISGRIYDRLTQRFKRKAVFKDVDSIPYGTDFRIHILGAITQCNKALIVIGPQWLQIQTEEGKRRIDVEEDLVRIEVETCIKHCPQVIPCLVKGAGALAEHDLPQPLKALAHLNAIQIREDPDFHRDMDRLTQALC
jgi:TIR domain